MLWWEACPPRCPVLLDHHAGISERGRASPARLKNRQHPSFSSALDQFG